MNNNLEEIQKYNHKLIKRHGHQDLDKLKEEGIYNYADFMDVQTTKKLKKWRRDKRKKTEQAMDLDSP